MRILIPLYWFETSQFTRLTWSLLSSEFLVTDQTGRGWGCETIRVALLRGSERSVPNAAPGSVSLIAGNHGEKRCADWYRREQAQAEPPNLGRPRLVSPILAGGEPENGERCQLPVGLGGLAPAKRSPGRRALRWL